MGHLQTMSTMSTSTMHRRCIDDVSSTHRRIGAPPWWSKKWWLLQNCSCEMPSLRAVCYDCYDTRDIMEDHDTFHGLLTPSLEAVLASVVSFEYVCVCVYMCIYIYIIFCIHIYIYILLRFVLLYTILFIYWFYSSKDTDLSCTSAFKVAEQGCLTQLCTGGFHKLLRCRNDSQTAAVRWMRGNSKASILCV